MTSGHDFFFISCRLVMLSTCNFGVRAKWVDMTNVHNQTRKKQRKSEIFFANKKIKRNWFKNKANFKKKYCHAPILCSIRVFKLVSLGSFLHKLSRLSTYRVTLSAFWCTNTIYHNTLGKKKSKRTFFFFFVFFVFLPIIKNIFLRF